MAAECIIRGDTYPVRQQLARECQGVWDRRQYGWVVPERFAARARAIVAAGPQPVVAPVAPVAPVVAPVALPAPVAPVAAPVAVVAPVAPVLMHAPPGVAIINGERLIRPRDTHPEGWTAPMAPLAGAVQTYQARIGAAPVVDVLGIQPPGRIDVATYTQWLASRRRHNAHPYNRMLPYWLQPSVAPSAHTVALSAPQAADECERGAMLEIDDSPVGPLEAAAQAEEEAPRILEVDAPPAPTNDLLGALALFGL